jgi:hypothetical protein
MEVTVAELDSVPGRVDWLGRPNQTYMHERTNRKTDLVPPRLANITGTEQKNKN